MFDCRFLVPAAALVFAAACDEPTAPRVRDAVEQADRRLFSGGARWNPELQLTLQSLSLSRRFPTAPLEVDGTRGFTRFVATVSERVYVPPPSSGGLPYVRRMLLAWDVESQRAIAIASDDSIATVVAPTMANRGDLNPTRLWGRAGFVTDLEQGRESWFGAEGSVELLGGEPVGPCKFGIDGISSGFAFVELPSTGETCQEARYEVSASTWVEPGDPEQRSVLDRWIKNRHLVGIRRQTIPGTRIVTQCPEPSPASLPKMPIMGCQRLNFWRTQSQFAPELGVDLSKMRLTDDNSGFHFQSLIAGSGPLFFCCGTFSGELRYTVSDARGRVYAHSDASLGFQDSTLKYIGFADGFLREGSRTLLLVPGRMFDHSASQFAVFILDVSVVPCPSGTRRISTRDRGFPYDGACEPAATTPLQSP